MSYTGEIRSIPLSERLAYGAVSLLVGTVGRAVFSVAAAPVLTVNAVRNAHERSELGDLNSRLDSALTTIFHFDEKISAELSAVQSGINEKYAEKIAQIDAMLTKDGDSDAFIASCSACAAELSAELENAQKEFDTRFISVIDTEMNKCAAETALLRRDTEELINRIENAEERKEAAASYIKEKAAALRAALDSLTAQMSDSSKVLQASEICRDAIDKALSHLSAGLTEAALIDIYSAEDALYLKLRDIITAETVNRQRYANAKACVSNLRKAYEDARTGELVFDSTASGSTITKKTDDMSYYYRGDYERIGDSISALEKRLCTAVSDLTIEDIADIQRTAGKLQSEFVSSSRTAYERMHNEQLRRETAKVLAARYKGKGYSLIPLTDKDKEYSLLDRIVMRFQKDGTDERIYLYLDADESGGHVTMKIDIEDHTRYEGGLDEIELARKKEREADCDAIKSTAVGRSLGLRQRCKNPGVPDTYRP